MAEFPKKAIQSKEEFAMFKSSLQPLYVGLKSKGKNKTPTLIQTKLNYGKFYLEQIFNDYNAECEETIAKGKEIDLQKLVVKMSKSRMKNKEDVLSA